MLKYAVLVLLFKVALIFSKDSSSRLHDIVKHFYSRTGDHYFQKKESRADAVAFVIPLSTIKALKWKQSREAQLPQAPIGVSKKSNRPMTERNLFSFHLNNGDKKDDGRAKSGTSVAVQDRIAGMNKTDPFISWVNILGSSNRNLNVIDEAVLRDKSISDNASRTSTSFPLASIINVEALLMASGKIPQEELTSDPDTALLMDMISGSYYQNASIPIDRTTSDITEISYKQTQDILSWDGFMKTLSLNINDVVQKNGSDRSIGPRSDLSISTDFVLNQAIQGLESLLNDAAASFSQERLQSLIAAATRSLSVDQNADVLKSTIDNIVATAENLAREQGLDVSEAAAQARATTKYTTEFLRVANGVLLSGYVQGEAFQKNMKEESAGEMNISMEAKTISKPLFHRFSSTEIIKFDDETYRAVKKGAEMAKLAGAIYQDTIPTINDLGHAMVATGISADVAWMITDSIGYDHDFEPVSKDKRVKPTLIRTITIRGFDASDGNVDRERLIARICNASHVPLSDELKDIKVHSGLLEVAKEVYKDVKSFIDMAGPTYKIVLNGHSIGGALSNLILMIMRAERGITFTQDRIIRVYTFGSPPVVLSQSEVPKQDYVEAPHECLVLRKLGFPSDIVYGYIQPWDPIVRLFSPIDPMYPLIEDLGADGVTLYATGPPRTLRPITRAILESWERWPTFRDDNRLAMKQNYNSIGVQHLLMPDPGRYLADRLVSVNVNAYPVDEILRLSSKELYGALDDAFPLDVFTISLVPTAIRSFVHHFFPAYTDGFESYVTKQEGKRRKK